MATTTEAEEPSMRRRCELLSISRSGLYYEPAQPDADELAVMRQIDEIHLEHPFYGSRSIARELKGAGQAVNRKRVQRLMRKMGVESSAPKTSEATPEHPVCP